MGSKLFLEDGAPRSHYGQGPPNLCITNTRADSSAEQAQETSGMIPGRPQPWEPCSFSFPQKVEATSLLISESILGLKLWEWSASVSSRAGSTLWMDLPSTGAWAFLSAQNHLLHHWDAVPQIFQALSNSHDFSRAALFTWNILPWNTTVIRPYYSVFVLCSTLSHTLELELKQQNSLVFVYTKATRVPSIQWMLNKCQQNKSVSLSEGYHDVPCTGLSTFI